MVFLFWQAIRARTGQERSVRNRPGTAKKDELCVELTIKVDKTSG